MTLVRRVLSLLLTAAQTFSRRRVHTLPLVSPCGRAPLIKRHPCPATSPPHIVGAPLSRARRFHGELSRSHTDGWAHVRHPGVAWDCAQAKLVDMTRGMSPSIATGRSTGLLNKSTREDKTEPMPHRRVRLPCGLGPALGIAGPQQALGADDDGWFSSGLRISSSFLAKPFVQPWRGRIRINRQLRSSALARKSVSARELPVYSVLLPYIRSVLRRTELFREFSLAEVEKVLGQMEAQEFADGDVVIKEGDVGDSLYILLDGGVRVLKNGTTVSRYSTPGSYFGEVALIQNTTRRATILAAGRTTLLRLSKAAFDAELRQLRFAISRNSAYRPSDDALRRAAERQDDGVSPLVQLGLAGDRVQTAFGVLAYLAVGTVYYTNSGFAELEYATPIAGFYYTVVLGLAIGFGKLTPLAPEAPLVSSLFVLSGALLLANALSGAIVDAVEAADEAEVGWRPQSSDGELVAILLPLVVWWAVGLAFGRLHEGMGWAQAVLFAMSCTSSVGVQGLQSSDDASLLFCALYCMVGVPLYASALGRLSLWIADAVLRARAQRLRQRAAETLQGCDDVCFVDLFEKFDKDDSGEMSEEELMELVKTIAVARGMDMSRRDVQALFPELGETGGELRIEDVVSKMREWASKGSSSDRPA